MVESSKHAGDFETDDLSRGSSERNPLVVPDTDRLLLLRLVKCPDERTVVRAVLGVAGLNIQKNSKHILKNQNPVLSSVSSNDQKILNFNCLKVTIWLLGLFLRLIMLSYLE